MDRAVPTRTINSTQTIRTSQPFSPLLQLGIGCKEPLMNLPQNIYHLAEAANWPTIRRDSLFSSYANWLESGRASEAAALVTPSRPRSHPPAELTVAGSVPDAARFVVYVQKLAPGESFTAK
jgi:hypothetical protein